MSSPKKNTVNCPNCGAPVKRKYGETVVCEYCGTALRPDEHERIMLYERDRQEISEAKIRAYNEIINEHKSQQASLERQRQEERRRLEQERERRNCDPESQRRKISLKSWLALLIPLILLIGFVYLLYGTGFGFFNPAVFCAIVFVFLGCVLVYGCLP